MTTNISEELPARKNAPAVGSKSPDKKAEAKGGTPQENSAKRIRQAVYDIRYRARREDVDLRKAYSEYMANSNLSPQEKTAVREKLFGKQGGGVSEQYMVTSVDWAEKNFADAYHKVFVEGIKKEEPPIELPYEQELAEEQERKYKVRVFDPKSEKSYVRFATREKISKLRAKGLKVEMTEHGEAYEGEKKKGEQTAAAMGGGEKKNVKEAKLDPVGKEDGDVDNDGDKDKTDDYLMNRRKAVGKAIAKKKGKKEMSEQSMSDLNAEKRALIRARAEAGMKKLEASGGAIKGIKDLRQKAGVDYENDTNMVKTAPGIYASKGALEARKSLNQRLDELPSNIKRKQVQQAADKKMMAAPIPEEFITDGATGTTSTEGQNAREIDVLPDKIAMKLKQVTVMPQDGTNPQAGRAPLMASHQIEGETIEEGEWFSGLKKKFKDASDAYNNSRGVPSPGQINQRRSQSPFAKPSGVSVTQTKKPTPKTPYSKGDDGKLTDFGAGGGKAKMAKTGMSASEVEQQGRANKGKRLPQIDDYSKYHKNSFEPEGEQLTEEEEDRRERYAFMNVARNLVRAKTGAKRPIAMDPEGTYKKAKEDLAKMVNSENPDKDRKESPCEEKQLSMADTFKQIAENAADKVKNAADKDAKDEAEKKLESKQEVKTPTVEPKSKDTTTPNTNLNTTTKSDTKTQSSGGGQTKTSKSSGPSGAAPSSDGGGGGMTNKERISRVDAGKDPYPMLSQDEKLRKSLGIRSASEVPDASNLLKKMGLEPGTQPDYLNRNNPENMPRPGAPAPKVKPTPKVKPADLKVKTEGKQLSMTDTIKQITSAPKEDTEQLDEFAGKAAAENVEKLLDRGRQVFDRLGIPNNATSRPTVTKDMQQEKIKKNVK